MLLAGNGLGNVLRYERALSFKENGNNMSLTSSSEKFSYLNVWQWHENHSNDYMGPHFLGHRMWGDNLAH